MIVRRNYEIFRCTLFFSVFDRGDSCEIVFFASCTIARRFVTCSLSAIRNCAATDLNSSRSSVSTAFELSSLIRFCKGESGNGPDFQKI
jgi:hypothetical protein